MEWSINLGVSNNISMLPIKKQTRSISHNYPYALPTTPKHVRQRISTTMSRQICKTLQTEESITEPITNRSPHTFASYFNHNNTSFLHLMQPKDQNHQYTFTYNAVNKADADHLLSSISLLRFLGKEVDDQKRFIAVKKEAMKNTRIKIEQKQAQVALQKKVYQRKFKSIEAKKIKMERLAKLIKNIEFKQEIKWMAKINTLNFKLKAMRQLHYNSLLFSETGSRDHRHKQRKQAKIKIPIIQSPYGQCYTDRNYYDHNQNKVHSREVRCHSNPFYQEQNIQEFEKMFTRIPSKQDSKGKMKTEYTDGYFTKRTSKMRGPEFLEDIDQPYEGRQPQTERNNTKRVKDSFSKRPASNLCLTHPAQQQPEEIISWCLGLESKNKQQPPGQQFISRLEVREKQEKKIKRIESESIVSAQFASLKEDTCREDEQDSDFGQLLEQTITNEQRKFSKIKALKEQSQDQQEFRRKLPVKEPLIRINPTEIHALNLSPRKQHPIGQSAVRIELSDEESSKITRRERRISMLDQMETTKYRVSKLKQCPKIQEESEEVTSMRTTPNNFLTPNEVSDNDRTPSMTPTPSHSSKPTASCQKNEVEDQVVLSPLVQPRNIPQVNDTDGISKIMLNTMSRHARNQIERAIKKPPSSPKIQDGQEDDLMTISLAKESKISRTKFQLKGLSVQNQLTPTAINKGSKDDADLVPSQSQKVDQFDFDFDLGQSISGGNNKSTNQSQKTKPLQDQPQHEFFDKLVAALEESEQNEQRQGYPV